MERTQYPHPSGYLEVEIQVRAQARRTALESCVIAHAKPSVQKAEGRQLNITTREEVNPGEKQRIKHKSPRIATSTDVRGTSVGLFISMSLLTGESFYASVELIDFIPCLLSAAQLA